MKEEIVSTQKGKSSILRYELKEHMLAMSPLNLFLAAMSYWALVET